jgi:hypothetical protein
LFDRALAARAGRVYSGLPLAPSRLGLCRALAAAAVLCALTAGSAAADTVAIPGNPLTVHLGEQGQLQAFRAGQASGIFYAPSDPYGDAGFFLAFPDETGAPSGLDHRVFGFEGSAGPSGLEPYVPATAGPVTGSGTAADPFSQITIYSAGAVNVHQTTTYVNGVQEFTVRWDVENTTGAPLRFRALAGADFFFDGSDIGTGIYTDGPPRFIGGTNADSGNSGGFAEVLGPPADSPPWSAYQALEFGGDATQIWGKIQGAGDDGTETSTVFDNSVVGEPVDNAGGVEWDGFLTTPLPAGDTASFALVVRSAVPTALQLSPPNAGAPQRVPITFTATAVDSSGIPYAGRTLRWAITGFNPLSGSVVLDAAGRASIVDPGTNAGADTVVAFVDFNNNGVREPVEPQASALATFLDNIAPDCRVRVTGDRVGGGQPLVITVNCDSGATMTVRTVLIVPPRRAGGSEASQRRRRPVRIRLRRKRVNIVANARTPVRIKIPKRVARKYAGRTLRARVTATVFDAAGNSAVDRATKRIKLKKLRKKRRRG